MYFEMCNNSRSGPQYNHLDRERYGKLEDSVDFKPGDTWDSRHQRRNISRRLIITITVCAHHDTTVTDSKDTSAGSQQGCRIKSSAIYC